MSYAAKDPTHFLDSVIKSEERIGSAYHKAFAAEMANWMRFSSYEDFTLMLTTYVQLALKQRTPDMDEAVLISVVKDMTPFAVGSAWWANLGFPTFQLMPDFYNAIASTDFGDAAQDEMRTPYPTFLVRLPGSLKGTSDPTPLFIYPLPASPQEEGIRSQVLGFDFRRMSIHPEPDEARQAYTQWREGIPLQEFVTRDGIPVEQTNEIEARATAILGVDIDPDIPKRARRVLGNTILYINSSGGLPSEKRLGPDVPVEREHQTEPRFRIGRPIKLHAELRQALKEGARNGASWTLMSRFVVRGHWRNQAHGPHMSLRRKQWILPFVKGPATAAEALERTFEVS